MATRQLLGDVEFTHEWYQRLLGRLREQGYTFRTFSREPETGDLFIRHDVDLSLEDALAMARLEAKMDVQSTYCVLLSSPLYNAFDKEKAEAVQQIKALGHDIGLHFSTHNYWDETETPREAAVEQQVTKERAVLETLIPNSSATVSFHRPPDWVLDQEFTCFQNTYSPAYFSEIGYVADSNQRWRDEPPEIEEIPAATQLLVHPGLWTDRDDDFEHRIERAVINTNQYVNRRAREEFIDPNRNQ